MKTHVLLGCGKTKQAGDHPLVDLYTGNLYRARLAYARQLGGPHWLLSAVYGIQRPTFVGRAYERDLVSASPQVRQRFASLVTLALLADTAAWDRLVVLASAPYVEGWAKALRADRREVVTPLAGLQMGEQLGFLRAITAADHGGVHLDCGPCDAARLIDEARP